MYKVM